MKFPEDFYTYLKENTLINIKGGDARRDFLEIWMVNVDGRIFARSWNKSKRSWFTAILETGHGEIEYDGKTIQVTGEKVPANSTVHVLIDKAYLHRFHQPENIVYAEGITQDEYRDYTIELTPAEKTNAP